MAYKPVNILKLMRRLAAHFALIAIWLGSLAPFIAASDVSQLHACCLRKGMHHCQDVSSEASPNSELRALATKCPYASPRPLTSFTGLNTANFRIASPVATGAVAAQVPHTKFFSSFEDRSTRAPPVLL